MWTIVYGVMLAVLLLQINAPASSDKPVPPPMLGDLATVWVGLSEYSMTECYRLELDAKGTGVLTIQFLPDKPAMGYRVKRTTLVKYVVSFELTPLDSAAEPALLGGRAVPSRLVLDLRGPEGKGKRKVVFQRYPDLVKRLNAVTMRADQYAKTGKE